jgi:hypothetical protein
MAETERFFLSEGGGKNAAVRFFKDLGKAFQEEGRIAAFSVSEGPRAHIRLVPEHGFMLDVERSFNSITCIRRVNLLAKEQEFVLKETQVGLDTLVEVLEAQFPLPQKPA